MKSQFGETPEVTKRRRQHERMLDKVGYGTEQGQRLLEKWGRESMAGRRSINQQEGSA